jgi:hypothetical protein
MSHIYTDVQTPTTSIPHVHGNAVQTSVCPPTPPSAPSNTSAESAPYVGLDYCSNTTSNQWSCTHPPSNNDAIEEFPPQQCYDDSIIAFAGPSVLQPILSLPTDVGAGTVWFSQVNPTSYTLDPNYTPTTTFVDTASTPSSVEYVSSSSTETTSSSTTTTSSTTTESTSTSSSSSSPGSAAPGGSSPTSTPPPTSEEQDSGLSSSAKIGIGVGVGVGGLGLSALLIACMLIRRRKRVAQRDDTQSYPHDFPTGAAVGAGFNDTLPEQEKKPRPPSELPGSAPISGGRYEDMRNGGYGSGYGTGTGTGGGWTPGHGHSSSTGSNWNSPAPTYSPTMQRIESGPRPEGSERVHELG